jgi:hypothetical protein
MRRLQPLQLTRPSRGRPESGAAPGSLTVSVAMKKYPQVDGS